MTSNTPKRPFVCELTWIIVAADLDEAKHTWLGVQDLLEAQDEVFIEGGSLELMDDDLIEPESPLDDYLEAVNGS